MNSEVIYFLLHTIFWMLKNISVTTADLRSILWPIFDLQQREMNYVFFPVILTMAYPFVLFQVGRHVTLRLTAIFSKRVLNRLSQKQEWSYCKLSWAVNIALNTSARNTFLNRPRGSLKVLIRVLVLTSYFWQEKKTLKTTFSSWAKSTSILGT